MPHIHSNSSKPVTAVLVLVLASLALAACGGSSSTSSTTTTTSASATTPSTGGRPGAGGGRFAAIRECLKKNGITLPTRKPGQAPGAGGFLGGGGGFALPKGVTKAQYEAAFKKCGGFPRGGFRGGAGVFKTAAGKQALAKIPVDAVDTSASGIDPDISQANAWIQAHRIAAVRHLSLLTVNDLISKYTSGRGLGFSGEPGVNVLQLNLALDRLTGGTG